MRYADIAIVTHQLEEYAGILESACIRYSIPFHLDRKISCMHTALLQLMSGVLELISENVPGQRPCSGMQKPGCLASPVNGLPGWNPTAIPGTWTV